MSKVLENRKSSFALATKKEIELTHLLSLAYHHLYKCCGACYSQQTASNGDYFKRGEDLLCEDLCYSDFLKVQLKLQSGSEIAQIVDEKEACIADCFKARKGNTDSIYCIERCNETTNARLKKVVARVGQGIEEIV